MAVIAFDIAAFRAQCPAFSDTTVYPDAVLQGWWDMAIEYISNQNYGYLIDNGRRMAINYMTAHLVYTNDLISAGSTPGIVTASGVDRVNVTLVAPKERSQWHFWLNQSPYGVALMALLRGRAIGGFSAGYGAPRAGIRQPNGSFIQ
jgi:hypothetical protein